MATAATALAQTKTAQLNDLFKKRKSAMERASLGMIDIRRLQVLMLHSVERKPELLNCSLPSIISSIMLAANIGLEPDDAVGSCYLVPFGTTCQLIIGYRGLVTLARRSEQIIKIEACIRYQKDHFVRHQGHEPRIEHIPFDETPEDADPGPVLGAYAIAWFTDGTTQHEYMSLRELNKIKSSSKAKRDDSPWKSWEEEMQKKSVIKRLCKKLPLTIQMATAIEKENAVETGEIKDDSEYLNADFTDLSGEDAPPNGATEQPTAKTGADKIRSDVEDKAADERKKERTMIASDFGLDVEAMVAIEIPVEVDVRKELATMLNDGADIHGLIAKKPKTWEEFVQSAKGGLGV